MTQTQPEQLIDMYRTGLKTAADLMKVSLQNAERMQNRQLAAIRTALDQQSRSLNELGQAKTIDDLVALQTRMAGAQMERAIGFWTELYQAQVQQAQTWFNEVNSAARPGQLQAQPQAHIASTGRRASGASSS